CLQIEVAKLLKYRLYRQRSEFRAKLCDLEQINFYSMNATYRRRGQIEVTLNQRIKGAVRNDDDSTAILHRRSSDPEGKVINLKAIQRR
uniref:Uncharacterized protein n=1 Tax=Romanomermis culicivorax TaxID=13658 RepID=A0A915JEL9_ROMCU